MAAVTVAAAVVAAAVVMPPLVGREAWVETPARVLAVVACPETMKWAAPAAMRRVTVVSLAVVRAQQHKAARAPPPEKEAVSSVVEITAVA